ncbi:N-acetylmuramoyl-L-alanine amidase [Paenibacillus gorillae]|uniref:N-acetylmuramoyl-L-alanine amidase n=1 Tax=Paenibacillus gorillae TaxID=1243662 RepID=UPI0004BB9CF1|nr:N-acetylmuramoyl-L-alanine amidase [Paenibacillus gorillae]
MSINYIVDHIPKTTPCNRRPGPAMTATTITIHNTGNPSSSSRNERAWLTNSANDRTASYHIVIDERDAIECLPLNEAAWHAGDGSGTKSGNRTSIGIEICESGNYAKTLDNAADLVAGMLRARGWGVDRLRRHYDWSGKICPRLMYDGGKWTGWEAFKAMVSSKMKKAEETEMKPKGEQKMETVEVRVDGKKLADGLYDDKAGVTYVPVRAVAEALGADVKWDGKAKKVDIDKKK